MTSEISIGMMNLDIPENMDVFRNLEFHRALFCLFDDEGSPSLRIEIKALEEHDGICGYLNGKEDILDLISYLKSRLEHMGIE